MNRARSCMGYVVVAALCAMAWLAGVAIREASAQQSTVAGLPANAKFQKVTAGAIDGVSESIVFNADFIGAKDSQVPSTTFAFGSLTAWKDADETRTSTTMSGDSQLNPVVSNGSYAVEGFLLFDIDAASDLEMGLNGTNVGDTRLSCEIAQGVGAPTMYNRMHNETSPTVFGFTFDAVGITIHAFHCTGFAVVTSGPASCGIQWAPEIAAGAGVKLMRNSWWRCTRLG